MNVTYKEVLLLLDGLEASMTKFAGSVDELEVDFLHGPLLEMSQ